MQYSDKVKVGKIKEYDGNLGEIVTVDNLYYFTKNDLEQDTNLEVNDLVLFKSKTEEDFPQAYYVKKLTIKQTK